MLTPDYLENVSDEVVELYSDLQNSIVEKIAKRILKCGSILTSDKYQLEVLQEAGMAYNEIITEISNITGKSENMVKEIFEKSAVESLKFDDDIYKKAGLNPIPLKQSEDLLSVLLADVNKTNKNIKNLTMTLANSGQTDFINAVNLAQMQVDSGAFDINTAISNAISSVSKNGSYVIYKSGKRSRVDVAVRRAVMTSTNQTCVKLQEMHADEMECDLMETTAHEGARVTDKFDFTNHSWWQGKVVSRSGKEGYLSLEDIGKGKIQGFAGINCRHGWFPFFEGISERNYSDDELEKNNNKKVKYKGKEMSLYEAKQLQRSKERKIRDLKREKSTYESIIKSDDASKELKNQMSVKYNSTDKKLKSAQKDLEEFTKETELNRDYTRERIYDSENLLTSKTKQEKDDIILTEEEKYSINRYVSSDSYKINDMLRNDIELDDDYTTFRDNLDSALNKCNNYQGNIVRVLDIKNKADLEKFITDNKVGTIREFKEYLSFSNVEGYNDGNIFIYTTSKTAKDIRQFNPAESEILYKRNSKFCIDNMFEKEGKYYFLWSDVNE